jgi:hypothetical protein
MPTTTHHSSARATAICRSTSPHKVTVSPSTQPFISRHTGDVVSTGGRNDFFPATMANNSRSVHDGGHLPVVFVGVMALVPLVPWDHSVEDADTGLRPPVSPRPFREVVAYNSGGLSHGLRSLALALLPFVLGFSVHIPFFRFHFGFAP